MNCGKSVPFHAFAAGFLALLAPALLSSQPAELHITEAAARRAAIEKPAPIYPPLARQLKVVGTVILECNVDEAGRISSVRTTVGNPILAIAAKEATKRWRFKPFTEEDQPASAVIT